MAEQGHMPIQAMMGWTEGLESRKDAVEMAKGFISKRYTAIEASWYAVAPFMGGWFWEVHEGGPGKGCLGSAIDALSRDPEGKYWFPTSDRAFQVMMRDGKPYCILLSKSDSVPVMNSGQPPLATVTKMKPAVRRGGAAFAAGAAMLGSGAAFLAGAMAFYVVGANPGPSLRAVDFSSMPHAQWNQVAGTGVEEIVSKLEMADGRWQVQRRPHQVPGLREIRDEGQALQRAAREAASEVPEIPEDEPAPPAAAPEATLPDGASAAEAQRQRLEQLRQGGRPDADEGDGE